ncbi:small acid-soluble spore protein F (minor alpha/beta-type SASP) [Desulfohalotomaculum tongense]|uniref:small, acid-soluble spore protein, alpha/beta type n=1 Tax=Desulforadius tongensis TaxID=1216062 RepID=UPI00195D8658|nr:small, acid-soluble spore protein, alpha/beta type [Desulforadius tongensis]MBM7854706.1 small acid-soluble spore protein F (minor alpha/beta-type SASP) [Desulforadius tongensis]
MARQKILSTAAKHLLAREMGVEHKIMGATSDYGNLTSRECGYFVKLAVQKAEENMI